MSKTKPQIHLNVAELVLFDDDMMYSSSINKRDVNLIDLKMVFFVKKIHELKLQT